jgi:hypothetical protein
MELSLLKELAKRSIEWRDEDKVSFLWGDLIVLAYVRSDYKVWYPLTDVPIEHTLEINKWLGSYLQTLEVEQEDERALQSQLADKKRNRTPAR